MTAWDNGETIEGLQFYGEPHKRGNKKDVKFFLINCVWIVSERFPK
jgi:hypothetical protein